MADSGKEYIKIENNLIKKQSKTILIDGNNVKLISFVEIKGSILGFWKTARLPLP